MPKRKRVSDRGTPAPCVVRISGVLAALVYRGRIEGRYRDETELVCALVRAWGLEQEPLDWPALRAQLLATEATEAPAGAAAASGGT